MVHPKDRDTVLQKNGVIYRYKCGRVDCEEEYFGESGRTFAERFREHMRAPSSLHDCQNITGQEGVYGQLQHSGQGEPDYCQCHQRGNIN